MLPPALSPDFHPPQTLPQSINLYKPLPIYDTVMPPKNRVTLSQFSDASTALLRALDKASVQNPGLFDQLLTPDLMKALDGLQALSSKVRASKGPTPPAPGPAPDKDALAVLQSIPHISEAKARALLQHYGELSLAEILCMDRRKLERCMGRTRSGHVRTFLDCPALPGNGNGTAIRATPAPPRYSTMKKVSPNQIEFQCPRCLHTGIHKRITNATLINDWKILDLRICPHCAAIHLIPGSTVPNLRLPPGLDERRPDALASDNLRTRRRESRGEQHDRMASLISKVKAGMKPKGPPAPAN